MKKQLHIKPLDFLFFILSATAVCCSFLFIQQKSSDSSSLIVTCPSGEYIYPLDTNTELQINGNIGKSIIEIADKKAWFKYSPCPSQTCMQCRPISKNGEWIACMPNQVFIRVEQKKKNNDVDITAF